MYTDSTAVVRFPLPDILPRPFLLTVCMSETFRDEVPEGDRRCGVESCPHTRGRTGDLSVRVCGSFSVYGRVVAG